MRPRWPLALAALLVAAPLPLALPLLDGAGSAPEGASPAAVALRAASGAAGLPGARGAGAFAALACPQVNALERCNVRATAATGPANEIDLAMNPLDPDHLVVVGKAYNATRNLNGAFVGGVFTAYATSFDGGLTWTEGYLQPMTVLGSTPVAGALGTTAHRESDPIVDVAADGSIVATTLRVNGPAGLPVYRSADGGRTFAPAGMAYSGGTDKQWQAVDRASGVIHLVTLHQGGTGYVRSTDHGATWSAPVRICSCVFPGIDVGPGGEVYVTGYASSRIWFTRSLDGGLTWSAPVAIAPHLAVYTAPYINGRLFRTPNIPVLAASPSGPDLWVAWADHPPTLQPACDVLGAPSSLCALAPDFDVTVLHSPDRGLTWGAPVRVNDDGEGGMQFMPAVAVSPNGRDLHVAWLDQRGDPSGLTYEAWYAHSPDGGATWDANLRLSDQPSLAVASHHQSAAFPGGVFVGDYIGLQATDAKAVVAWPDTRYGRADIVIATVV